MRTHLASAEALESCELLNCHMITRLMSTIRKSAQSLLQNESEIFTVKIFTTLHLRLNKGRGIMVRGKIEVAIGNSESVSCHQCCLNLLL